MRTVLLQESRVQKIKIAAYEEIMGLRKPLVFSRWCQHHDVRIVMIDLAE